MTRIHPAPIQPFPRFHFPELVPAIGGPSLLALSDLAHLPLDVQVPLGRIEMNVDELLALRAGSVIPLERRAGESLQILANGIPFARGEIRIDRQRFAIRIRDVLETTERA